MKRHFYFLFITALLTFPAQAQRGNTPPPGQRILYIRTLPQTVKQRLPRNAQSCFFGTFRTAQNSPTFAVHLFRPRNFQKGFAPKQNFTVDLFRFEQRNSHQNRYEHIQRFSLQYSGWGWAPEKFGAQLLWVDPKQKKQPIIKFDCMTQGDYRLSGDHVLAIFPDGLQTKPTIQSFTFGGWRASDTSGADIYFDSVDKNGLLEIREQIYLATGELPTPPPVIWKWNGKAFAAEPQNAHTS